MTGLSQGVNATVQPLNGSVPDPGATIVCSAGDLLHTDVPYPHPDLEERADTPNTATEPAGDVTPAEPPALEDPASTDMTAEGAPAPTAE